MEIKIVEIILSLIVIINGGSWWVNYSLKRRLEKANADIGEINACKDTFGYYIERIQYLEKRLSEAENTINELKKLIKNL